jgi:hypothetical protein
MATEMLVNEAGVEAYRLDGFVIPRDVVPDDVLASLRAWRRVQHGIVGLPVQRLHARPTTTTTTTTTSAAAVASSTIASLVGKGYRNSDVPP